MTTFEAALFAAIGGVAQILPISFETHQWALSFFTGWSPPPSGLRGALLASTLLAVLIRFRHDWASIVSTFLQVLIFRKKPMTLDERLPLYLALSLLPVAGVGIYLREPVAEVLSDPVWMGLALIGFSLPLWVSESWGRKTRGMVDWNWLDCLLVGAGLALYWVPGAGAPLGCLALALLRNYQREAAAKYLFYSLTIILAIDAFGGLRQLDFSGPQPTPGVSWLTFSTAVTVGLVTSFGILGWFLARVERGTLRSYGTYRVALGMAILGWHWAGANGWI